MLAVLLGFAAITIAGLLYTYIIKTPELPRVDLGKWWGVGARPDGDREDDSIRPFKIEFDDAVGYSKH